MTRWYRFRRRYRVEDEIYVLADTAKDALDRHWDDFAGVAYGFEDETACYATEYDLADVGGELAPIQTSRVRRVEVLDVPAWMVAAAVRIGAQEKTPEIEERIEVWNHGRAGPHVEDAPLREMVIL